MRQLDIKTVALNAAQTRTVPKWSLGKFLGASQSNSRGTCYSNYKELIIIHVASTKIISWKRFQKLTSSSSILVDELMRRPENLKLNYFLEKMTLYDV